METKKNCLCGCGQEVKKGNKYVKFHHLRGRTLSEKHKEKISKSLEGNQRAKGFKHTEETRRKVSVAGKGKKRSEETCAKLSEIAKNRKYSDKTRKKLSEVAKTRTYSKETRQKLREISLGRVKGPETLLKLSIANKGQVPSPKCGRGKRSFYNSPYQGKVCFRSSYEKKYAEFLDINNVDWLYEPKTFDLGETTYLPDFYLIREKKFIEVKGWMSKLAQDKIDLFKEIYHREKLDILFKEDLIEMGVKI